MGSAAPSTGQSPPVSYGDLVWIDGLFVGQLDGYERDLLERAVAAGQAEWAYEGVAGFLGLAKVRVLRSAPPEETQAVDGARTESPPNG